MNAGIVLVHGYSGSPGDLAPLAAALRNRFGAASVTVAALPGHTGGGAPSFDERVFTQELGETIAPSLREGRKLILVGHSTGGTLLLSLLAEKNIAPALLVLAAVPKRIDTTYLQRWSGHRTGKSSIAFGDIAAAISFINRTGGCRIAGSFPVLALHGAEDDLVPAADAHAWEAGTFEGTVRTALVAGAGHHLFQGPASGMTLDIVLRDVEDALFSPEAVDEEVIARVIAVEPEAERFLALSPGSKRHLARSASGLTAADRTPVFAEEAETEPVIANIEITTRCNLSCAYCARSFRAVPPEDMPLERFRTILALLPHACRVTLVGLGEPLLHPRLNEYIALAAGQGRRVGLVTNAMLLDRKRAEALLAAGLRSIAFSLDAPDQELASELRPGTDLSRVIKNIKGFVDAAKAYPGVSTAVFTAVSQKTLPRLEGLVDLVAGLGVHVMMMTDLNFEENKQDTLWQSSGPETAEAVRKAVARAFAKKLPVLSVHGLEEFGLATRYDRFLLIPPDSLCQRSTKRTWCGSPWQTIPVNVRGEVTLCDCQPDAVVGDILSLSFDAIWNGDALREYRKRMLSPDPPEKCLLCPRF